MVVPGIKKPKSTKSTASITSQGKTPATPVLPSKEQPVDSESVKEVIRSEIRSMLKESIADDLPKEDWVAYGEKIDDFINDTIELAYILYVEGEELIHNSKIDPSKHERFTFISSRLGFLKHLRFKLAQKFEGLQRDF